MSVQNRLARILLYTECHQSPYHISSVSMFTPHAYHRHTRAQLQVPNKSLLNEWKPPHKDYVKNWNYLAWKRNKCDALETYLEPHI